MASLRVSREYARRTPTNEEGSHGQGTAADPPPSALKVSHAYPDRGRRAPRNIAVTKGHAE